MSTVSLPDPATIPAGSSIVVRNLAWADYERWLDTMGDRPCRSNYDRGTLEVMSPSSDHERFKGVIGRFIETLAEERGIPLQNFGSTTWRSEELDRGLEPNECFYLNEHAISLEGRDVDLANDPPPDLVAEVEISHSLTDRLAILASLRVPEVWRFDGSKLRVFRLTDSHTYEEIAASLVFPFLPLDEVAERLRKGMNTNQTQWGREIRAWVRTFGA